jgi:hypothetical protein
MARRREGRFDEAVFIMRDRVERWPSETEVIGPELEATLRRLRRAAEADSVRALLGPVSCGAHYQSVLAEDGVGAKLDEVASQCFSSRPWPFEAYRHELRMRRPERALRLIEEISADRAQSGFDADWINQQWAPFPVDLWRADALRQTGDTATARRIVARHVPELERFVSELPNDWLRRRMLLKAYTHTGREVEAMRVADEMMAAAEALGDRWAGVHSPRHEVMLTYLAFGRVADAVEILEGLELDGAVPWIPLAQLRTDPLYQPLCSHPDFEGLVQRLEGG